MRNFVLAFLTLTVALPVFATDGVLEINQACAESLTGCFSGDAMAFPVTITTSGSYRLTSDLTNADANVTIIEVQADNVTIDLNGFSLLGPVTCTGAGLSCLGTGSGDGISAFANSQVTVLNGTIRGIGRDGIELGDRCRIEGVTVQWSGQTGVGGGFSCVVRNSSASLNGGVGFTFLDAVSENCMAISNKGPGFFLLGSGSVLRGASARDNGNTGILVASGSRVEGSVAFDNTGSGIILGANSAGIGNSASGNGTTPLDSQINCTVGGGCQITDNAVLAPDGTGYGLDLRSGVTASGYSNNTVQTSGTVLGTVNGGVDQGGNNCNGSTTCP